jgi:hypothetical protein
MCKCNSLIDTKLYYSKSKKAYNVGGLIKCEGEMTKSKVELTKVAWEIGAYTEKCIKTTNAN